MTYQTTASIETETLDGAVSQYRTELERSGYSQGTINEHVRSLQRLRCLLDEHNITLSGLTAGIAEKFAQRETSRPDQRSYDVFIAKRFTDHLAAHGLLKPPPSPTVRELARAALQSDYEDHLRRQRGLSERTIYHCWRFADRFLDFRFEAADVTLSAIVPGDVVAFLQQLTSRKAPFRDKTPPTHLRNFLKYLFRAGLTPSNLALCVPSVAQRYNANLPRHIALDQVEAVLAAVRADELVGRRNYAMVLLLARFGLRAAEVVAMQLDDIDWRAGELVVRGKGKNHDRVPLPPDVGEALAAYVQQDRTSTSRALFVSSRAPHRPFKDGQVLNTILKAAFASAGVAPPCRYVGSHVLRHSLAVNLVRQGASLAEVADMLRHRSRVSTLIYAKLDVEGLRSIAQPWPVAGGAR